MSGLRTLPHTHQSVCEVCDCHISYPDFLKPRDLDYIVCQSFECRRIMHQKSTMSPVFFKAHLKFSKKLLLQRREKTKARKEHIVAVKEKQSRENEQVFNRVLLAHESLNNRNSYLLVIPTGLVKADELTVQRKQKYIEYLTDIIAQAGEYENASEVMYDEHHDAFFKRQASDQRLDSFPQLRLISDNLCCMCKGGCCASGKDHAYLSVFSMRRFMDNHPHLSASEILNLYCSKISPISVEGSCINQTDSGCVLPRYMRSDICNGYYCEMLKDYQKTSLVSGKLLNVVAVQRSSTYWDRYSPGITNEIVDAFVVNEEHVSQAFEPVRKV